VLDTTIGTGGIVSLPRQGKQYPSSVLIQPDGNLLVAADTDEGGTNQLLLQRFLPTGAPDTTFGTQGAVLASLGGVMVNAASGASGGMVLMADGRIVGAGNPDPNLGASTQLALARFLPDGSPDPTFGSGGHATVYVGDTAVLEAISLTSDGKVLIAGSRGVAPGGSFIARLWN
jgi:uncharacterized delta-60 repeat protein